MLGMQNVVQRGKSAVAKGMKAIYAVKVGQKQSGRSERREKRGKLTGMRRTSGREPAGELVQKADKSHADVAEYGRDEDITTGSSRFGQIELRRRE